MTTRSRYIPKATRTALAQQTTCAHCGGPGPFHADHIVPVALGGGSGGGQIQRLCVPCHKSKTRNDIRMIRKADRQRKAHLGLKTRKGPKLRGRGFDKSLRKRMDGTVERRA